MTRRQNHQVNLTILTLLLLTAATAVLIMRINSTVSDGSSPPSPDVEHPITDPTSTISPEGPGLSSYPEGLSELYYKNEDARDFVLHYLDDRTVPAPEDIDLTALADTDGVPLLMQWDERWGYNQYAGNLFGLSGCGPTCLSMAAIYLTGDATLNPLYVAEFAERNGYAANGNGTKWTLFSEGAVQLGLTSRELPLSEAVIDAHLTAGEPVVLIMGPGDFTDSGHFIVLTGVTDGGYTVNDPNSYKNSEKRWPYEAIADQIRNIWALSYEGGNA